MMLESSGETTPPWGEPRSGCVTLPSSMTPVRIPLKWGTKYGEVGQRRSEATLVTAMISEVPHLSQGFCDW